MSVVDAEEKEKIPCMPQEIIEFVLYVIGCIYFHITIIVLNDELDVHYNINVLLPVATHGHFPRLIDRFYHLQTCHLQGDSVGVQITSKLARFRSGYHVNYSIDMYSVFISHNCLRSVCTL
jgi:hypothetical protein